MSREGMTAYRVLARFPLGVEAGEGSTQRDPDH